MRCETCEVSMQLVDKRFSSNIGNRQEYQRPECGRFRERNRHRRR